jgi:GT2 family glycosyltransferase
MNVLPGSVSIIVLNWNGRDDTLDCLDSLTRVDHPCFNVIVVDNGSVDDSVAAVRARYPDVMILETGSNLGYAGGNDVAIRHCLAERNDEFILLLNNDTVVDPAFLTALVDAANAQPTTGIFGPKIYFRDRPDVLWYNGARWTGSDFVHIGYGKLDDELVDADRQPPAYITGCALFVRREVLLRVGLLDERFFLLFEDVDFCYRARRLGFQCAVVDKAVVWHKASSSIGEIGSPVPSYFHLRNRLLFGSIHLPFSQRILLLATAFVELLFPRLHSITTPGVPLLQRLYWLLRKHELIVLDEYWKPGYWAGVRGTLDYLRSRFGDCPRHIRRFAPRIAPRVVPPATPRSTPS